MLGGSGFIGAHIVQGLLSEGHQVTVLDRNNNQPSKGKVVYIQTDFNDVMALSEALIGVDVVIHLISTSVPSTSNNDPVSDVNGNLINTLRLLELMKQSNVNRLIYFSSGGTVYGHPVTSPMDEKHPTNPICSYGIVKLAIEKYILMYAELYGFKSTILRPSNPYGPGQKHMGVQGFIGTCISNILDNKKLTIWGDGSVVRDYIYITDLVALTIAVIKKSTTGVYNVSTGIGYSLNEIINFVQEITSKKIDIEYKTKRNFDIAEMILDNSSASAEFNWHARVDIKKGLACTVDDLLKIKKNQG